MHEKELDNYPLALRNSSSFIQKKFQFDVDAADEIDAPHEGPDFCVVSTLRIVKFGSICVTLKPAEKMFSDKNTILDESQERDVVLVGGANTGIPKIRILLSKYFYGKLYI
ncbi:Major heat shock 70 kDa protein Ba [Eumeta japonica]|uniref:Major heat shock 70 kDa protein Ba n=1 Tax=Eumeta variegata TaxID=151549 RepID=A0A4C1XMB6_EUMVA|nr:Major heat shock 70 kDa protein Ba [Eumeta japonica]